MHHLGRVVGRPAGWKGDRRDQTWEPHRPEIDARNRVGRELFVVERVIVSELLAIQFVAPVHGRRMREVILADPSGARLGLEIGQAVGSNRRGINEGDRPPVRLALALRELEQVQRSFDVDMVGRDRRELRARRQERREMENAIDFELGEDAIEERDVGNRAGELAAHKRRQRRVERTDVNGDDGNARRRQTGDETVTNFAAGARNQNDWLAHLSGV